MSDRARLDYDLSLTGHRRGIGGHQPPPKWERSFKFQSSTFQRRAGARQRGGGRESISTKPQARVLSLEAWSFPGAWSLRFEAFLFPCCSESEIFAHLTLHSFHPLRLLRANASSGN